MILRGAAREIVLVDRTRKRAQAVAADMRYGAPLSPMIDIRDGDYAELAGAELVMITAGVNEKTGGATDRNDLAGRLRLLEANARTSQVFLWSSARLAGASVLHELARHGFEPEEFRGRIEREVRYANIAIIEGNDASQYGIGMVTARIAQAVIRDERIAIPIGSHHPRYGVTLSLPSIVGRPGVINVIEPDASEEERRAIERSADTLRQAERDRASS